MCFRVKVFSNLLQRICILLELLSRLQILKTFPNASCLLAQFPLDYNGGVYNQRLEDKNKAIFSKKKQSDKKIQIRCLLMAIARENYSVVLSHLPLYRRAGENEAQEYVNSVLAVIGNRFLIQLPTGDSKQNKTLSWP